MGKGASKIGAVASFKRATLSTLKQHTEKIAKLRSKKYGDGTYDLDTLDQISYNKGYQVTFSQIGDKYTRREYADRVNEFLAKSSDGKSSAGKFDGEPEVSFHVNSKREAMRLARKYNQISIWDWKNEVEIETGGTGRRK